MSTVKTSVKVPINKVFRALGDPTRLRILLVLQEGEHCVSDVISILQVSQAKASHHLNALLEVGLIEVRKQGLWSFYQLTANPSPLHASLLACLDDCADGVPEFTSDRRRAAAIRATGGCCPK